MLYYDYTKEESTMNDFTTIRMYNDEVFNGVAKEVIKAFHERTPKLFNLEMWEGFASFEVWVTNNGGSRPDEYFSLFEDAKDFIENCGLKGVYTPQEVIDNKLIPLEVSCTWEFEGEDRVLFVDIPNSIIKCGVSSLARELKKAYLRTIRECMFELMQSKK